MKIDAFLTCVGTYGVSTGAATALEGAYALTGGTTGIFYNQLYSTGAHFYSGQLWGPSVPIINVSWPMVSTGGSFSGKNCARIGYQHTGNFGLIMDIEYSGCARPTTQYGMVLVSTAASPSSLNSGFLIGITDSHRLYFQTNNYCKTVTKELGQRNMVAVHLSEAQYVTFGIHSLEDNTFYSQKVALPNASLSTTDLYIGNFLTQSAGDKYTGFYGKINQLVLFNSALTDRDIAVCANCIIATGFNTGNSGYSFLTEQLTGMYFSGVLDSIITGYVNVSGVVPLRNGTVSVAMSSGMTGVIQTGQIALPMFTGVTISGFRDTTSFIYDQSILDAMSTYYLYFNMTLTDGDTVEICTYPSPNLRVGFPLKNFLVPADGLVQVYCNGLAETFGTDYTVDRGAFFGFESDDILSYDLPYYSSLVTPYSGCWNRGSRILMSGGTFYPPAPQYTENTTGPYMDMVQITGLSGVCVNNAFYPNFGYDLYMNGQRLVSGMYYKVITSGTSGFVVMLTGTSLPQLIVNPLYHPTGGDPTGVESVEDAELTFMPRFSGVRQYITYISSDTSVIGPLTGFGDQVWVNGLRGVENIDYRKIILCSYVTGVFQPPTLPFELYNSQKSNNNLWNISVPPRILSVQTNHDDTDIIWIADVESKAEYPNNGACVEVWTSQLDSANTFGGYYYLGKYNPSQGSRIYYTGYGFDDVTGQAYLMMRYNSGNHVGPWYHSQKLVLSPGTDIPF